MEKRKHGEMLPSTIRAIICDPNCGKTNVLICLIESPNVSRTCMSIQNRAIAKISISRKYVYVYRRNRLFYVFQQRCRSTEQDAQNLFLSLMT